MLIAVSYSQLVQFSLESAHNSIRRALAKLLGISPLRIVDIHVTNETQLPNVQ